jgi:hypothetical protein
MSWHTPRDDLGREFRHINEPPWKGEFILDTDYHLPPCASLQSCGTDTCPQPRRNIMQSQQNAQSLFLKAIGKTGAKKKRKRKENNHHGLDRYGKTL